MHTSAVGFNDQYRKGEIKLEVDITKVKEGCKEAYVNVSQIVGGHEKDIYFAIPDVKKRPLLYWEDPDYKTVSVVQDWQVNSPPQEEDIDVINTKVALRNIHGAVCRKLFLDPELFPLKITRMGDAPGEEQCFFSVPGKGMNKQEWDYNLWSRSPGTPTFKVTYVRVRYASKSAKFDTDNQIVIGMQIGKYKFDPHFKRQKPKAPAVKRSLPSDETAAKKIKTEVLDDSDFNLDGLTAEDIPSSIFDTVDAKA